MERELTFIRRRQCLSWLGCAAGIMACGAAGSAHAGDELANAIAAQLGTQAVVRAQFTQSREMAALKRPVISSGQMTYSREQGILWLIEKPFALAYALAGDKVVETGADGVQRERKVPALAQVTRVMRALLGADLAALKGYFDVTATGDASRWALRLTPRQAQLAQVIAGLSLSGGRFIETIRIDEASGDATTMNFRNSQADVTLTAAERRLFGLERR